MDLVFRLVFFHQSLRGVAKYPAFKELSSTEKLMYCDPLMYKYMSILMMADSSSYTFLGK